MEPLLGEIRLFAFGYAPYGWALCNGQIMQVNQNQALFSLIGNQFGGTAPSTFALPNLNDPLFKTGANFGPGPYLCYYIATSGLYPNRP